MEALESRVLFSGGTSTIRIYDAYGNPAAIDANRNVWLLFHGMNMSKDNMTSMASGMQAARPGDQVLIVDWSVLASSSAGGGRHGNAEATADYVAGLVKKTGIRSSRVNLLGFSMGGEVISQLAENLQTRRAMINRIIALDPAGGGSFSEHSSYSIAFTAGDRYSSDDAAASADDTVLLTGLPKDPMVQHGAVFGLFNDMVLREGGLQGSSGDPVSPVFSLKNIMGGTMPAWRKDAFDGTYEATLKSRPLAGSAWLYEAVQLDYRSSLNGKPRSVKA